MSLLLPISAPMGSTSHTHLNGGHTNGIQSSNLLQGLLDNPLIYGEPVGRASFAPKMGLREVFPGPPSPPRGVLRLESVKEVQAGEEKKEEEPTQKPEAGKNGKEEGRKEKRIKLGPSTPPHLRKTLPEVQPSTATSTLTKPPSSSPKTQSKVNGKASVPSTPTQIASSSSTATATATSGKSLHAPIPDSALAFPPEIAKGKRPAAGLYNPSMACYANATLQVMMHTPPFLREAINHHPKDCEFSSFQELGLC
jgi:hypothetical protein